VGDRSFDRGSRWQPRRQRPKPKKKPKAVGFGHVLAMLHEGRSLPDVLRAAFGDDDGGRIWQRAMQRLLEQIPTIGKRRRVVHFFFRWWSAVTLHGSQYRVVDAGGFVGHKHELRPEIKEVIDPESGEVFECEGKVRLHHVPKARAQGLSAREDLAPRTLDAYKRILRGADRQTPRGKSDMHGLVHVWQPKFDADGAVRPRAEGSKYAYAQARLLLPPSREMLRCFAPSTSTDIDDEPLTARERIAVDGLPDDLGELADLHRELRAG